MNKIEKKVCAKCGRELPITHFAKSYTPPDGYRKYCNECRAERDKKRKAETKAKRDMRFWECDIIARPERGIYVKDRY